MRLERRAKLPRWAAGLVAAAGLAACANGPPEEEVAGTSEAAEPAFASTPGLAAGDVEAPEVFQASDQGLWDGRPSLGGMWVAHPDVAEPERVVVRNQDNGRSVTAALFRREREAPGPALQVSSEAAEALGMLAGAPAALDVTALRRAEPPAEAGPVPTEEVAPQVLSEEVTDAPAAPAEAPEASAVSS